MERTDVLALMGELKLYGMRAAAHIVDALAAITKLTDCASRTPAAKKD